MGLLDAINTGSQGGYGGLLDSLFYQSPLLQPQAPPPQPQYDQMGNSFGQASIPQPTNPFGPLPQMNQPTPAMFAPPSAFNTGAAPVAGFAPSQATSVAPQTPTPASPTAQQVNDINVGGYQMPRMGSVADYMPSPATPTDVSAQSRQPQQFQQPQDLPPALGGSSALGRIFNPDGLVARLTGNDTRSLAQQNALAQYKAIQQTLVDGGMTLREAQSKALLAVMNPEAGKTILAQALDKKNYGFTKLDNDTIIRTDPLEGKAEVAYKSEGGGTITGPDGKPIAIPPGADRKTFVNEVSRANAKAAAGEKTEVQAKAEIFANKMEVSNKEISDGVGTSLTGKIASGLPLGNYVQSPEYQKYKQASSNFITALLRQESGAAISKSEFDRYDKEYMPQPGDGREVLAQKAEARRVAIEGMKKGAGPGYKSPSAPALPSGWSVQVR